MIFFQIFLTTRLAYKNGHVIRNCVHLTSSIAKAIIDHNNMRARVATVDKRPLPDSADVEPGTLVRRQLARSLSRVRYFYFLNFIRRAKCIR